MVVFEAVSAKFGDSLILRYAQGGKKRLWVIDGGPAGVWTKALLPRLEELRGAGEDLVVDLAMLSHVDDDHVNGILSWMKKMTDDKLPWINIRRFWHNSFADLAGSGAPASVDAISRKAQQAAANDSTMPQFKLDDPREVAVLASIGQGRELRDYITQLEIEGNQPFGSVLSSKSGQKSVDGAKVTVLGPIESRLKAFKQAWKDAAGKPAAMAALFREDLDESVTNLSSLVLLVEVEGKKILLTGDARGDDVVAGLKAVKKKLPLELDIMKMPHHGSDRNISEDFLAGLPAKHYVVSADGKYGNPDPAALTALVETRGAAAEYTIHLTNKVAGIEPHLKKLAKGRNFKYQFRNSTALSMEIKL